jgi:putative tryptophan/tyrosine transport system substrate-binding protein
MIPLGTDQMAIGIGRRQFISALGAGAAAWPLTVRAQQARKLPTVGFMGADAAVWSPWTAAFVKRLAELGWIENRTVTIEYRWNEGRRERMAEIAAEFVRLKVDIIVTAGGEAAIVKRGTSDFPIVFAIDADPVSDGLVASLAHPGGNVTGLSNQSADVSSKRLELLQKIVPHLHRLAIIFNGDYHSAMVEAGDVQVTASRLGIEVAKFDIKRAEDIAPAFDAIAAHVDALEVMGGAFIAANRTRIITLALGARLPTIFNSNRDYVQAGGLMSYAPNFPAQFRRAAEFVDKILRGTKPGDIPVEQPIKFDLTINLTTAKALGLTIPESFLSLADEVIE